MIGKSSRNADRKAAYARMASEQDKEIRNRDISNALGEGTVNVEAKGKWVHTVTTNTYVDESGKTRTVRTHEKHLAAKEHIMPTLPTSAGRSAKRARLKASRQSRLVSNQNHPNGSCGNVGCYGCNPATFNAPKARFAKDGKRIR